MKQDFRSIPRTFCLPGRISYLCKNVAIVLIGPTSFLCITMFVRLAVYVCMYATIKLRFAQKIFKDTNILILWHILYANKFCLNCRLHI